MSDNTFCCDISPNDNCNKTCCPDYDPVSDWCKAFNKRTLEQQKETTKTMMDGIWFNIEDAKNTIGQAEQYLAIIYELLIASLDQVIKVSSSVARTDGDLESASSKIIEFVNEIYLIVGDAQYNGRHLLQDGLIPKRSFHYWAFGAKEHKTYLELHETFALNGDALVGAVNIFLLPPEGSAGFANVLPGDIVFDATNQNIGTVKSTRPSSAAFLTGDLIILNAPLAATVLAAGIGAGPITVGPGKLTNKRIYGDTSERSSIHYRLAGPRGACRNVGSVFNDFVYDLPSVGIHSLGLTSWGSESGQDYHIHGIFRMLDHHFFFTPPGIGGVFDDFENTIKDFNCAIKKIDVELDKLRAYRYVLCLREKQVSIYKAGQDTCFKNKCKI